MALPLYIVALELFLRFVEQFLRYQRLVLAVVPDAALYRILEDPVVEGVLQYYIDATQRHIFIAPTLEVDLELEPLIYFPAAPFLVRDFLEHLLYHRRSQGVYHRMTFSVHMLFVAVAHRRDAGAQPHLTAGS